MVGKIGNRTYKVADLYKEAAKMVKEEMASNKKGALTPSEEKKSVELAEMISKMVLKEMKIA